MAKSKPQKHHHNHGKYASVPAKGDGPATPPQHWEMHYDPTPRGEERNQSMRNWDPMFATERPCTHNKINECDH